MRIERRFSKYPHGSVSTVIVTTKWCVVIFERMIGIYGLPETVSRSVRWWRF